MQSQTRLAELFIMYLFGSTQLHITQCSRLKLLWMLSHRIRPAA